MSNENTTKTLPAYQWREDPVQPPRHRRKEKRDLFLRRHGILLIFLALFTVYSILLSAAVYFLAGKIVGNKYEIQMADWKQEYAAEQYLLTGEASRAAAIDRDAISLAHDGDIWNTEEAFKSYCWNVIIREKRADYPNSVQDVLEQTGQYAFYDPDGPYNTQKYEWAKEVLEQAYTDQLPRYLTMDHQYLEMRNNGDVCILHSCWNFNTINDEPWRWRA